MILQFLNKFFSSGKREKHSDGFVSKEEKSNPALGENIPSGRFEVKCTDEFILPALRKGDGVNLYTRIDLDDIKIYCEGALGGGGFIGFVPHQAKGAIRNHLLHTHSNFGTKTVATEILEIQGNILVIEYIFVSQKEIDELESMQLSGFIQARKAELDKTYKMKSPVELEFFDFEFSRMDEEFHLGFKSKDWYIQNPLNYPIQLIGKNGEIISETHSQKAIVDRILKAHFNGQALEIINRFKRYNRLVLTISPMPNLKSSES